MHLSLSKRFPLFGLCYLQVSSVSDFFPDTRGEDGHLFRLTCSVVLWGGGNTASTYHWRVWAVLAVSGPHQCLSSPLTACVLSRYSLLRPRVALQGNRPKQALGFVRFPGLSRSGSRPLALHKGTDSVGPAFCALPRSEQVRRPGARRVHSRQVGGASYHLPGPRSQPLVSPAWCSRSAASGVPCASSGGLISDCDPSGGCQPSRIPQVSNWGPAHSSVEDAISGAETAPCLPACLLLRLWWGMGWSAAG